MPKAISKQYPHNLYEFVNGSMLKIIWLPNIIELLPIVLYCNILTSTEMLHIEIDRKKLTNSNDAPSHEHIIKAIRKYLHNRKASLNMLFNLLCLDCCHNYKLR